MGTKKQENEEKEKGRRKMGKERKMVGRVYDQMEVATSVVKPFYTVTAIAEPVVAARSERAPPCLRSIGNQFNERVVAAVAKAGPHIEPHLI